MSDSERTPIASLLASGEMDSLESPETIQEALQYFERMEIGRAIRMTPSVSGTMKDKPELVGYVLPLNGENTKHLIILSNGAMLVIKPKDTSDGTIRKYRSWTYPSPDSADFLEDKGYKNIDIVLRQLSGEFPAAESIEVMRNDRQENAETLNGMIDIGVSLGFKLREERIAERERSSSYALERIKKGPVFLSDSVIASDPLGIADKARTLFEEEVEKIKFIQPIRSVIVRDIFPVVMERVKGVRDLLHRTDTAVVPTKH